MSYSQTAAISSINGGTLHLNDVTITGSFNAGISAVSSTVWANNISIDLKGQIFGFRGTDTVVLKSNGITVSGTEIGIELYNCSLESSIFDTHIDTSYFGLSFKGNNPIEITSCVVNGSAYGITSNAPLTMTNVTLSNNQIGLLIEDNSIVGMSDCTFEGFGQWAIEDETWESRFFPGGNVFIPSNTSIGTYAWWGWIVLGIYGPDNIEISGAEVSIQSSLGSNFSVQGSDIGVIWGYGNETDETILVSYNVKAKWGTATAEGEFSPQKGVEIKIVLPLTDIILKDIQYLDGSAQVKIECNGSEAGEVQVDVFVDGKVQEPARIMIGEGEEKTVIVDLDNIRQGKHELQAVVSSNNEYSGTNGYLQDNNGKTVEIEVEDDEDRGLISIILLALIFVFISFLIGITMLQRQD
jgi:hypothetical protein